ncbi:ATP-binding protein [Larkinella insperata]|uniref:histidine kinase n=1 Tax=Larkinella insperata TaxID=332158 RepID=A0ABW3Q905_9BACT|nr:ATP-binding protein [Larkinella insperata]
MKAANLGAWVWNPSLGRIDCDDRSRHILGLSPTQLLLYPQWTELIHPDDVAVFQLTFENARLTPSLTDFDISLRLKTGPWIRLVARPAVSEAGKVASVAGVIQEVTQLRQAEQITFNEDRFRSLIREAPVATSLYVGPEFRIEVANAPMLAFWGKGDLPLGKPLAQALPELAGQPFLQILEDILATGKTHQQQGAKARLVVDGEPRTFYFDFTYKPLFNELGQVYAIMNMAIDVTDQVLAQQELEETDAVLRSAIELAQLGNWSIDLSAQVVNYSPRLREWFGLSDDEVITVERGFEVISESDRERVQRAMLHAIATGTDGIYDVEYKVNTSRMAKQRILHVQGRALRDAQGHAYRITGTAQDVTLQRQLQWELESQLQERTEQLAAANEELQASNEELQASNEELQASNEELQASNEELYLSNEEVGQINEQLRVSVDDLRRSNENLQQFAYIASHDLQEPLRKVQSFSNLLQRQYAEQLSEMGLDYLERIQGAAERMSSLIRDLLTYSKVSTRQESFAPLALQSVFDEVLQTLEFQLEQTRALVEIDQPLPVLKGDPMQLRQLFQNLLTNALKFTRPGIAPRIHIRVFQIKRQDLPAQVRPTGYAQVFYQICVIDQGIGFDNKYQDRIFQLFQRLHGRSEYSGTGIGLAICQRVAENHGGAITANSQPGEGATFCVYLPE